MIRNRWKVPHRTLLPVSGVSPADFWGLFVFYTLMFNSVHHLWRAVAVVPAGPAAGESARCSVDACVSVASEAAAPDESTSAVLSCAGLTAQQTNPGKCAFPPLLPCLVEVCILCLCAGGAVMQRAWLCCHLPPPPPACATDSWLCPRAKGV